MLRLAAIFRLDMPAAASRSTSRILRMGNLAPGIPLPSVKGAEAMPMRRSSNGAVHTSPHSPQTDRDCPERVIGINRNRWSGLPRRFLQPPGPTFFRWRVNDPRVSRRSALIRSRYAINHVPTGPLWNQLRSARDTHSPRSPKRQLSGDVLVNEPSWIVHLRIRALGCA